MKTVNSIEQAVELSLDNKTEGEIDASFKIEIESEIWDCYTVSISNRDILCYCDKGTATFLVDTYGHKNTFELFDWNKDEVSK